MEENKAVNQTGNEMENRQEIKPEIRMWNQTENQNGNFRYRNRMIVHANYQIFGIATLAYACFYTFCLYQNRSGITFPFFTAGTLFYFYFCMNRMENPFWKEGEKKTGIPLKKDAWFYGTGILLLGISTCLTGDGLLIFFNHAGVWILMLLFLLHHFYKDEDWSFGKYLFSFLEIFAGFFSALGHPFSDVRFFIKSRQKKEKKDSKGKYVAIGLCIAVPLVFLLLNLLGSADRIFGEMVERLLKYVTLPENLAGILWTFFFSYVVFYALLNVFAKREVEEKKEERNGWEPVVAITFTSVILAVYLPFCFIQIGGLFLGKLNLPEGYTYAGYARQGFFQLLFVCVINLCMLLICTAYFKERKSLKVLLMLISACTYIMLASSAYRMLLYIGVYHLTTLRILVLWALFVIFLIMTGGVIAVWNKRFMLFRYGVVVVTVLYIALSFSHPDTIIAKYNIAAMKKPVQEAKMAVAERHVYGDMDYLLRLSSDGMPVVIEELSKEKKGNGLWKEVVENENGLYYFRRQKEQYQEMNFRTFNVSRYRAKKAMEALDGEADG